MTEINGVEDTGLGTAEMMGVVKINDAFAPD